MLFYTDKNITAKRAFLYGFLLHFTRSCIVLTWFKELYSMSAVDVPPFIMIAVIFLGDVVLSALQSIPFGICSILINHLHKSTSNCALRHIFSASFFAFTELFQTLIEETGFLGLIGFPWVVSYVTQHRFLYAIQSASVFGAIFITFIIILVNSLIAHAIFCEKKAKIVYLLSAFGIFFANFAFGACYIAFDNNTNENAINAAVYQDNNSSYDKWSGSARDVCDEFVYDMELFFSSGGKADIIVLSETVFTVRFDPDRAYSSSSGRYIADKLCELSKKHGCSIVFGGFSTDDNGEYNSMFLIDNGEFSKTVYNKRTLVPFGEYLPYEKILTKLVPALENFNLSGSYLKPGASADVFESSHADIGGIICYDSIFYYNTRESAKDGAQIIALSTNDSWYNDSAAIYQHYAQSAFRAIETDRCLLRSATTGVSGIIDNHGRTVAKSNIFEKTIVSGTVQKRSGTTPFVKFGYTYLYALTAIGIIYCGFIRFRHRKNNVKQI